MLLLAVLLAVPGVPMTGVGETHRALPQPACASAAHRQFDFWVGDWLVYSKAGVHIADSSITLGLDGCVVLEHWLPLGGTRGRSLNAWDEATGQWHQTWVADAPPPSYPTRMAGGLRTDGVMAMSGVRRPWYAPENPFYFWRDAFTWTPGSDGSVVQAFTLDIDNFNVHQAGALTYKPAGELPAIPLTGTQKCISGVMSDTRRLDFTLGTWTVTSGDVQIGTTTIVLDPTLSQCLIEESFSGKQDYRATGWLIYDPVEDRFYRTIADNAGNWSQIGGQFAPDGALVLQGPAPLPGAPDALLRVTWKALSADRQVQLWETSRDGGASWKQEQTLTLSR